MNKKEWMQELNKELGTKYNWSMINVLCLERLVLAIRKQKEKLITKYCGDGN